MSPFFLRIVTSVHDKNNGKRAKVVGTELNILPHALYPEKMKQPPPRLANGCSARQVIRVLIKTVTQTNGYDKILRTSPTSLRGQCAGTKLTLGLNRFAVVFSLG